MFAPAKIGPNATFLVRDWIRMAPVRKAYKRQFQKDMKGAVNFMDML
jgi:hypothetical protein